MERKKFIACLSENTQKRIKNIFQATPSMEKVFLNISAETISEKKIPCFETLLGTSEFRKFIKNRIKSTASRFEKSTVKLLRRIEADINPLIIAQIADAMSSENYRDVERSFFKIPVDIDGHALFEEGFIKIAEQNPAFLNDYIDYCASIVFQDLNKSYDFSFDLRKEIFNHVLNIFLAKKQSEALYSASKLFSSYNIIRLLVVCNCSGMLPFILGNFVNVFIHHPDTDFFIEILHKVLNRYIIKKPRYEEEKNEFL